MNWLTQSKFQPHLSPSGDATSWMVFKSPPPLPGPGQPPGAPGPGEAAAGAQDGGAAARGPGPGLLPAPRDGTHRGPICQGQEESLHRDSSEFIETNCLTLLQ